MNDIVIPMNSSSQEQGKSHEDADMTDGMSNRESRPLPELRTTVTTTDSNSSDFP